MNSIMEQLSKQEIINSAIINRIKESIHHQYPDYTPQQKAQKLAISIHKLIDRSLPEYSKEIKKNVRNAVIKEKLSQHSLTIDSNDIVNVSIRLVALEDIQTKLIDWLQTNLDLKNETIELFVESILAQEDLLDAETETAVTGQIHQSDDIAAHPIIRNKQLINRKSISLAIATLLIMVPAIHHVEKLLPKTTDSIQNLNMQTEVEMNLRPTNSLPNYLQYKKINEEGLQQWLHNRNSILAEEPYFSTILTVADQYNLHPFLLFAITGQEQGFVPRNHQNVTKIANNPFNVYHSWKDYNTDIVDSSEIAARTLINLSEERPHDVDPIQWINRKYAEDENWWKGVSSIFEKLETEIQ